MASQQQLHHPVGLLHPSFTANEWADETQQPAQAEAQANDLQPLNLLPLFENDGEEQDQLLPGHNHEQEIAFGPLEAMELDLMALMQPAVNVGFLFSAANPVLWEN